MVRKLLVSLAAACFALAALGVCGCQPKKSSGMPDEVRRAPEYAKGGATKSPFKGDPGTPLGEAGKNLNQSKAGK